MNGIIKNLNVYKFFQLVLCPAVKLFNLIESHTWLINSWRDVITLHYHELIQIETNHELATQKQLG